jgi:SAM-dependent methyltransferase
MERDVIKEEYLSGARTRHPVHTLCYGAVNMAVLCRVPASAKRLLDLGCGTGALGRELKEKTDREVFGVTYSREEAALAAKNLDCVIVSDLNDFDPENLGEFDCIICSHVLEHLYQPEQLLIRLRPRLSFGGRLIAALPNILFWKQRIEFLRGRFRYTEGGLMDSTHFRFFDYQTGPQLLKTAGFKVVEFSGQGSFPQPLFRNLAPKVARIVDSAACRLLPGLFGHQFIIVGKV